MRWDYLDASPQLAAIDEGMSNQRDRVATDAHTHFIVAPVPPQAVEVISPPRSVSRSRHRHASFSDALGDGRGVRHGGVNPVGMSH
jgi:hypothetical protein